MRYAIAVVASLAVGAVTYMLTMRRTSPQAGAAFSFQGSTTTETEAMPDGSVRTPGVTYVPVSPGAPASWQSRSIGLLGLMALVIACASTIGVALYQVGSLLWRLFIQKLQSG